MNIQPANFTPAPIQHWYDYIINYWSQLAVLFGIIGYILKSFFDYRTKQREIKYSNLRENKILEVKEYLKCCHAHLQSLREYYYTALQHAGNYDYKVIRGHAIDTLVALQGQSRITKLFLDLPDKNSVDNIMKVFEECRLNLNSFTINDASPARMNNLLAEDEKERRAGIIIEKEITQILDSFAENLGKDFGG